MPNESDETEAPPPDIPDLPPGATKPQYEEDFHAQTIPDSSMNISKVWDARFFSRRKVQDRPFIETVAETKLKLGLLAAFLQSTNASGPSWEVEQVQRFCNETSEAPDARVWIDDRSSSSKARVNVPKWVTCSDLSKVSRQQTPPSSLVGTRRRLTFAPELTSNIIIGLIETATWFEAQTLRPAVRQHIAGETSIRVFIPVAGFKTFRLEVHLPYLLLKSSTDDRETDEQGKKLCNDLSFMPLKIGVGQQSGRYSIYEAQTTVVISGADHEDWHGYAFGNPGPNDALSEEDDCGDENDGPEAFFEEEEDFFATGGCEPVINPGDPIWDPRVYFLRTLQLRLAVVVQANEYLVQTLEAGFKDWEIQEKEYLAGSGASHAQDMKLRRSLAAITKMTKLFQLLHVRFSKATATWENFSKLRGDILYFADLQSYGAKSALHKVEESFEKMANLKLTLSRLQLACEESRKIVSHENLEMSRVLYRTNTDVVKLTKAAAEMAKESQKVAKDTSRATRVNVQLLMITTAVVIALQYFCSDRAVFAFERNVRIFWISIVVLIPSLGLLTFTLHVFDRVKDAFTQRLHGTIDKAVLPPTPPPSSPA